MVDCDINDLSTATDEKPFKAYDVNGILISCTLIGIIIPHSYASGVADHRSVEELVVASRIVDDESPLKKIPRA
jgi:hypothetical protein